MTREPVDWPTGDLLAHRARATPDREALVDVETDRRWTYRQLHGRAGREAEALADWGVGPGDTLGLLVGNRVSFVDLLHAAMRLRATLVPLNTELTTTELAPQVERAGLDCLLCEADTEAEAVAVAGDVPVRSIHDPHHEGVGRLDRQTAPTGDVQATSSPVPAGRPPDRPTTPVGDVRPVAREWTRLVVFTSGTTGEPKGVRLTAGNLVASATASAFRLGVQPDDRWLVCLPTYHVGGLAPVIRSTLYGTTVVLQRAFDADGTRAAVADHGVTGVSLVPTMLSRLLDVGWEPPEHLRVVLLGGAPASPSLVERCRERGVPVCPTYGTTETASQVATALPEQAFEHPGTVGQPLVFTDVRVLDGDGRRCEPGETGEIVVDGPTVTPGYLDEGTTEDAFGERGLHTGDVGSRDDDGRLRVVGRADDAIVTGGENVHPAEVADVVRGHPGVDDVAVVGLDDREWGERVAALVVPAVEEGSDEVAGGAAGGEIPGGVDPDELDALCRERLAGYKVPKTWGFTEELPRTTSGTVDREAVRERLGG